MIQVTLPQEQEEQLYRLFVNLAMEAFKEVGAVSNKRYYTQNEVMKMFKCNLKLINNWKVQGLRHFRKGNSIMYDIEDIHAFIEQRLKQ